MELTFNPNSKTNPEIISDEIDLMYKNYSKEDMTYNEPEITNNEKDLLTDLITDLEKIKNYKFKFIITSLEKVSLNNNRTKAYNLKCLIKICNETKEVFKNIWSLLHLLKHLNIFSYFREEIHYILNLIDEIEFNIINKILDDGILKMIGSLLNSFKLNMCGLNYSLNKFIKEEKFYLKDELNIDEILIIDRIIREKFI